MIYTYNGISYSLKLEGNYDATAIQMNPEENMLSEISQTLKDKYCMIPKYMKYLEQSDS